MKGLIFSITAGQGHNQTAMVLANALDEAGIPTKYMDVFEYINPLLSKSVSEIYLMSSKNMPKVYGKGYRIMEKREVGKETVLPKLTTNILARRLLDLVKAESPDVIICTHVFAALLATELSESFRLPIKTIGIVTDFTIHPLWEDTRMDYYVIADALLAYSGGKKGLAERRFLPFGIPIDPKFSRSISQKDALRQLKLPEKKTVLMMSGSMGFGDIAEDIMAIDRLNFDFQIVTICGNNKKMRDQIDALSTRKEIFNYGYVNNVDVFMDAAECIITKPGGLTTSEALAKKLPMIMNNPVPGQEDRNVEFLLNAGAALKVSKTYPLDEALYQLFSGKTRREQLKASIETLRKPHATEDLVRFIRQLPEMEKNA